MSDYKFAGLNIWTYSDNRAIIWLGRGSHYSDNKRHLRFEFGRSKAVGVEVIVGSEDNGIKLRLGLIFCTLYFELTRMVKSNDAKMKKAMAEYEKRRKSKAYSYQFDFADGGRTTGFMFSFYGWISVLGLSLWEDGDHHSNESARDKLRGWPYCEGVGWRWYPMWALKWETVSKQKTEPETHDYTYTRTSGEIQKTKATITAEVEHKKRWWWYPFKQVDRSIWVDFEHSIGEGVDTWKGGTYGCGYTMLENETPLECLRRMESERKFRR